MQLRLIVSQRHRIRDITSLLWAGTVCRLNCHDVRADVELAVFNVLIILPWYWESDLLLVLDTIVISQCFI